MRLRNIPGAREHLKESSYVIDTPEEWKGHWREYFKNDHPLRIEIGTGKGCFIVQMAQENPDVNFIGIEKYSSVLLRAVQKQEEAQLTNLVYLRYEAELLEDVFAKDEVDLIYLNFSDPWPKKSQQTRRLPCKEFLRLYSNFLGADGHIEFKTDNRELFDFAVDEIVPGGYRILQITYDLHNDPAMNAGNVMTEYEKRFSGKGNAICKYVIERSGAQVTLI